MNKPHSILLQGKSCVGCTHCVKSCPTKAIRVHNGKAKIKDEYCIDCGECIRICGYHAKYAKGGRLAEINDYKYPIALIPGSFYGQFEYDIKPEKVAIALKEIGFKSLRNISEGKNILAEAKAEYINEQQEPVISSSCQAVTRLIKLLYPELLDYLLPFKPPEEILATKIKDELAAENNLAAKEIGIFLITACPAKLTAVDNPLGIEESSVDGAIAVNDIYCKLLDEVKEIKDLDNFSQLKPREKPYLYHNQDIKVEQSINVTGLKSVNSVLEELSRENLSTVKAFNLSACDTGCFAGVLNVKNPHLAKFNYKNIFKDRKKNIKIPYSKEQIVTSLEFKENVVNPLDNDILIAMNKLNKMEEVLDSLPKLDCAACGAPDCQTLAEDIVNDLANKYDCIFILRQEVADLADEMARLAHEIPPIIRSKTRKDEENES